MKKLLKYTLCAAVALSMASCSEEYLDLSPENAVSESTLFSTPESAQYACNALSRLMVKQYWKTQGFNGEGTIYAYNGEYPGDGVQFLNKTGYSNTINANWTQSNTSVYAGFGWYYYYRIIGNANQIILHADAAGNPSEWAYVKAQALTFRAYAYTMLTQLYCRRWSDRDGQSRGVVMRLDASTDAKECTSLAKTYEQIYDDLDKAISLFEQADVPVSYEPEKIWMTNVDVAHAVYSRAALIRNDWQTVITHSQAARKNHPIMGAAEYVKGFNTANTEWIWGVYSDDTQSLSYYSFYNYMSGSVGGSNSRSYPPLLSKQVADAINPDDARFAVFAIPTAEEIESDGGIAKINGSGLVTKGDFFERAVKMFRDPGRLDASGKIGYYIGAKFVKKSGVSSGSFPIFRAAEMIYNEAEAQFHLGNEGAVKSLLEEATKPYQEDYTCTLSGDELWEELVAYKKFDLWSEGQNWFDLKRRGASMVRLGWADGGSWNKSFIGSGATGGNYGPEGKNNWTYVIPQTETNYNNKVISQEDPNWTLGTDY